jgi:hypothetical protein
MSKVSEIAYRHVLQTALNNAGFSTAIVVHVDAVVEVVEEPSEWMFVYQHNVSDADVAVENLFLPSCPISCVQVHSE